jgi:hypothetical protein
LIRRICLISGGATWRNRGAFPKKRALRAPTWNRISRALVYPAADPVRSERAERSAAAMKGIILRAAVILAGTAAYLGLAMALASAG